MSKAVKSKYMYVWVKFNELYYMSHISFQQQSETLTLWNWNGWVLFSAYKGSTSKNCQIEQKNGRSKISSSKTTSWNFHLEPLTCLSKKNRNPLAFRKEIRIVSCWINLIVGYSFPTIICMLFTVYHTNFISWTRSPDQGCPDRRYAIGPVRSIPDQEDIRYTVLSGLRASLRQIT